MNIVLGQIGIWVALVTALVAASTMALANLRGAARPSMDGAIFAPLVLGGLGLSVVAMERALITHDFTVAYVAQNNALGTPLLYSMTGLWSALEGSILLWGFLLALVVLAVVLRYRDQREDLVVRWATVVLFVVSAFFSYLMAVPANPFTHTVGPIPVDGAGPNALLQDNPLVAIHPPLLYLGFVGFTVPFAFTVGMLITGRVADQWLVATRRWTLLSWTSLSVGIVLGAWWSYQVLGWGGFWAWDPVENAALMPWLVGTAYLHSVLVQERRGLLRVWNLSLSIGAFALTILGTFLTRSGVIQSVHSFSASTLGPTLIGAFGVVVLGGFGLLAWRGDRLRSPGGVDAPFGREGAFIANNVAFVGFALVVLLGTVFPLFYEAVEHQQVTVGTPYFATIAGPLALFLLFLMAVAPALSWRRSSAEVLWKRLQLPAWLAAATVVVLVACGVRGISVLLGLTLAIFAGASAVRSIVLAVRASFRQHKPWHEALSGRTVGGMVVHLGVVLMALGAVTSLSFVQRAELAAPKGVVVHFNGHSFEFLGFKTISSTAETATEVLIRVDGGPIFCPASSTFTGTDGSKVDTPAIDSGLFGDLYLTWDAVGGGSGTSAASLIPNLPAGAIGLGVVDEPLLAWIWAGGLVVGLGGLLALVPSSTDRRRRDGTGEDLGRGAAEAVPALADHHG